MKIFGIAGRSGSGKTTLIEKLIPLFVARGLNVSLIKHAHHEVDIDKPGKDSFRFRAAGSFEVMLLSDTRWALMRETPNAPPTLKDALSKLSNCDLVLVEGYKSYPIPKIEVYRQALNKAPLYPDDKEIIGIATHDAITPPRNILLFPIDEPGAMTNFILEHALSIHHFQNLK